MNKTLAGTLAFALALTFASTAMADGPDGADLFKKKCAVCHGPDGTVTPAGDKIGAPAKLGAKTSALSEEEIANVITKGKDKMKGFEGKLTPEEIKAIATHAKTLAP